MKTAKKHVGHGIRQFDLTQNLINNLQQFDLSPSAKLVLIYLSSCYNPKHKYMFPKQCTIASKLGISERSVVRAIQELVKERLIIIECKNINNYVFTSKIVPECPENMSDDLGQYDIKQSAKMSHHVIEQTKRTNNEPLKVEDYKILKAYAIKHGAKNVQAYINKLISSGSAKEIIEEEKKIKRNAYFMAQATIQNRLNLEEARKLVNSEEQMDSIFFARVREKAKRNLITEVVHK